MTPCSSMLMEKPMGDCSMSGDFWYLVVILIISFYVVMHVDSLCNVDCGTWHCLLMPWLYVTLAAPSLNAHRGPLCITSFSPLLPWQPNTKVSASSIQLQNETYPDNPSIQNESFLNRRKDTSIFLVRHGRHKTSIMNIGIELVAFLRWIESL